MPERIYTPEQLEEIGVPFEIDRKGETGYATELLREQVDSRRWVSVNELIFRAPDDGKAYRVYYERGLTERQDGTDPWNYDDTIKATEVEEVEVTVKQWQPLKEKEASSNAQADD